MSVVLGSASALPTRLFGCQLEIGGQGELISDKYNLGTQFFVSLNVTYFPCRKWLTMSVIPSLV